MPLSQSSTNLLRSISRPPAYNRTRRGEVKRRGYCKPRESVAELARADRALRAAGQRIRRMLSWAGSAELYAEMTSFLSMLRNYFAAEEHLGRFGDNDMPTSSLVTRSAYLDRQHQILLQRADNVMAAVLEGDRSAPTRVLGLLDMWLAHETAEADFMHRMLMVDLGDGD